MAHRREKFEAFSGIQEVPVAVVCDRDTGHILHDEVRTAAVFSRIQYLGNVGMVHQGQGLTLRLESGDDLLGVHPQLDDLQGYATTDGPFLFG